MAHETYTIRLPAWFTIFLGSLPLLILASPFIHSSCVERKNLEKKASEVISKIEEPFDKTTSEDWNKAYNFLGLRYRPEYHEKLSNNQLRVIIDHYSSD